MKFVVIADDDTGATDAAGMLTSQGVRTCLATKAVADAKTLEPFEALVIGTQSRSIPPGEAYEKTKGALEAIEALHPQMVQIKYCSTFDSTPKGNIGPSLDAALDWTGQASVVVCPALPVNGRTTYMGYHFVNGVLLSESPMKDHPLNPMTDANLVRWLSRQTQRTVGLLNLDQIREGPREVRLQLETMTRKGVAHIVTDAVAQEDIGIVMRAVAGQKLISGGSGITAEVPPVLFPNRQPLSFEPRIASLRKGTLVLSGSLSQTTQSQTAHALKNGFRPIEIDPLAILAGGFNCGRAIEETTVHLAKGEDVLVYSPANRGGEIQAMAARQGLSDTQAGEAIGKTLSKIGAGAMQSGWVGRLVISGGETSGTVCRELGFQILEIGLPLAPGVPYCFPANRPDLLLVLKSGNFGSVDLYTRVSKL